MAAATVSAPQPQLVVINDALFVKVGDQLSPIKTNLTTTFHSVLVTKIVADWILVNVNSRNRRCDDRQANKLNKDGLRYLPGYGISFDEDGILADGQTRLTATSQDGKPWATDITVGLTNEHRSRIDTGRVRGRTCQLALLLDDDGVSMVEEKDAAPLSAAINLILKYVAYQTTSSKQDFPAATINQFYTDNRVKLNVALSVGRETASKKVMPAAPATALYFIGDQRHPKETMLFFNQFISGQGPFAANDPILVLRDHTLRERYDVNTAFKYGLKALAAHTNHQIIKRLRFGKKESLPRL